MKKLHFLARTGETKISSVACGFSLIKIHYFDNQKRFINRTNGVMLLLFFVVVFFFNKISLYSDILLKK